MKYIRTQFTIFEVVEETDIIYRVRAKGNPHNIYSKSKCQTEVVKSADTVEELCDMFVGYIEINGNKEDLSIKMSDDLNDFNAIERFMFTKEGELYGAIWTDKGLIYVAKMNGKGELELL